MAQYVDCKFEGATLVLDGNEYLRCHLHKCRIVVTRGNFSLRNCDIDGCTFDFGGEAANIKNLLLSLVNQPKQGGHKHG